VVRIRRPKHSMYYEKRQVAEEFFNGECFVCKRNFGKGFSFHHRDYKEGRKTYKDFKSTIKYNQYVLPEVRAEPDRFYLLCTPHHRFAEYLIKMKPEKRYLLLQVVEKSSGHTV